jgi:hypothetical protein
MIAPGPSLAMVGWRGMRLMVPTALGFAVVLFAGAPLWAEEPAPAAASPSLSLPEPEPVPRAPEDRAEAHVADWKSYDDAYYTAPLRPVVVGLRAVPSFGLRPSDSFGPSFALDVTASVRTVLERGYSCWALWPELGYTVVVPGGELGHELSAGLGIGYDSDEVASLRWAPRFAIEVSDPERLGRGVRNALIGSLYDIVSVELSHQWLYFDDESRHDLRLGVGLDVLVVLYRAAAGNGLTL